MKLPVIAGRAGAASGAQGLLRDSLAGVVASVVLIVNIVSFSALMFPGAMAPGASTAIWAMLVGSGIGGLWIAWKTSLPPLATGMDSPTGAVLVLLAVSTGHQLLASGASPQAATQATMLLFACATALSGALMLGLGVARCGAYLRFVPFFVVAGFLGATGWLLIAGGIRLTTGRTLAGLLSQGSAGQAIELACALAVLAVLLALRRWVRWPLALPVALLLMTVTGAAVLHAIGLSDPAQGWYLPSLGALRPWSPLQALRATPLPAGSLGAIVAELLAVAIVALVSLVTKTSSIELARKAAGDLDCELRAHGVANLAVAPFGGIACGMQIGSSRLLQNAGGVGRWSGVACALVLVFVGLSGFDLPALIPLPVAAGLVFQLGWGFLVEGLSQPLAQRDGVNLALALAIMAVCVRYGYLVGVIGGVIGACLLFALSYSRIGVVRLHLSRSQFAGNVSRSAQDSQLLDAHGEAIQIYWLAGYIFFGSSESVFERVRGDFAALPPRSVSHVILDLRMVSGADASATVSLDKLRNFCRQHGAVLVFSTLALPIRRRLERDGLLGGAGQPPPFADISAALAYAEDAVLARSHPDAATGAAPAAEAGFAAWLQQQLGGGVRAADFMAYLECRRIDGGQVLYREGEAADDIDLVAAGRLLIEVGRGGAQPLRVRSITTHTVVGEMGFFRRASRSATVSSEGPATLYTLRRAAFDRMQRDSPELALAFQAFLLRTQADRIGVSDRMVMALSR